MQKCKRQDANFDPSCKAIFKVGLLLKIKSLGYRYLYIRCEWSEGELLQYCHIRDGEETEGVSKHKRLAA